MAQMCFWTSLALIFYAYAGYPLALLIISLFRDQMVLRKPITPSISFIIPVHNEERRIREKIENTLQQNYPGDKLQIVVASDYSQDKTDEIVGAYASHGVHLVRLRERGGKELAQKEALQYATGEILVFSDAATILPRDAVSQIVQNFADPTVGCVSSVDRLIDADGKISGEGVYVKYEMFLRSLETKVNTLVGLSGSFFAARRDVCQTWASGLQSDFNTLLNSVKLGLRGVSDPESIGYYKSIADESKESERKVRTVLRGISVLMKSLHLLNPLRYRLFSWQLLSHKLCRWLVPFAMILAFVANVFLLSHSVVYVYTLCVQLMFYLLALWGVWFKLPSKVSIVKLPTFFMLVNLSILSAWCRYARGERLTWWSPSQR
ncbi:MAG: glycosyltransferase family 2 protein [Nitrospirae bacterium]|nr:MAG: glycosyltransferase family 2 protein [Nitrospirota bacterium]